MHGFLYFKNWEIADNAVDLQSAIHRNFNQNGDESANISRPHRNNIITVTFCEKGTPVVIAWALSPAYAKRPKLDQTDHLIVVITSRPNLSQFKEQQMFLTLKYYKLQIDAKK